MGTGSLAKSAPARVERHACLNLAESARERAATIATLASLRRQLDRASGEHVGSYDWLNESYRSAIDDAIEQLACDVESTIERVTDQLQGES